MRRAQTFSAPQKTRRKMGGLWRVHRPELEILLIMRSQPAMGPDIEKRTVSYAHPESRWRAPRRPGIRAASRSTIRPGMERLYLIHILCDEMTISDHAETHPRTIARSYQGTRNPIWFQDIASGGGTCCFGHNPAMIGTVARPRRLVPTSRDLPQSRVQRSREDAVEYGSLCRVARRTFTSGLSQNRT